MPAVSTSAALLMLADSRLPTGGHAHSGGMEEAVARGAVGGAGDLERWLRGRLHAVGVLDAAFAVAAHARSEHPADWAAVDAEWSARTPSPALRRAGRAQGRGLLRAARACWPAPLLEQLARDLPGGPPWPIALGGAGRAAGCDPHDVALTAATAALSGPAWATTRLLGTDPFAVAAVLAGLAPAVEEVAAAALAHADPARSLADLPTLSAPLLDLGAERHATWEVRLFAS